MLKAGLGVALVALVAATAPLAAPPQPSAASQLRTYLATVKAPLVAFGFAQTRLDRAFTKAPFQERDALAGSIGLELVALAAKLATVRPPVPLRPPHGDLVRGVRIEGNAMRRFSADREAGMDALDALERAQPALDNAIRLVGSWNEELVVQLRRSGVAVPAWIKAL